MKTTKQIQNTGIAFGSMPEADKKFVTDALQKGASRRQVLGWLMAMGATAAGAGSVLMSATKAVAATPQKGGTIKAAFNIQGPSDTLDPIQLISPAGYSRARAHYNSLVQLDDNVVPQPELAESFEANADATEWTFKIRKDVHFHDGSKLTADDVIWSMNRHLGAESQSKAKGLMKPVSEWKKMGEFEVKAICSQPYSDLPAVLGEKHFKIAKADTVDFATAPGTGPFKLESFRPGIGSVHVRNEDYWREGAHVDAIEIFGITDPVARVSALIAGDATLINGVPPKSIQAIEEAEGVGVRSIPAGSYMGLNMHVDHGAGKNPGFVNAIKHIMPRERIVKNVLKGHGTLGNDHPINVAYGVDHCADLAQTEYDPEKAKALFEKSGLAGAKVDVAELTGGLTDAMLMLQRECQKIGFNLEINKVPTDGYWGSVWQKTPMNVASWNMRPTATIMLDIAFAPGAPWNDTGWHNDELGVLLGKVKAETNPANKHELHCQMQKIVRDNCPVAIPAHRNVIDGFSSKLKGVPELALGDVGGAEWPEFSWLES